MPLSQNSVIIMKEKRFLIRIKLVTISAKYLLCCVHSRWEKRFSLDFFLTRTVIHLYKGAHNCFWIHIYIYTSQKTSSYLASLTKKQNLHEVSGSPPSDSFNVCKGVLPSFSKVHGVSAQYLNTGCHELTLTLTKICHKIHNAMFVKCSI